MDDSSHETDDQDLSLGVIHALHQVEARLLSYVQLQRLNAALVATTNNVDDEIAERYESSTPLARRSESSLRDRRSVRLNDGSIEYAVDGRDRVTQLFNLEKDPWEMTNLADDPEYAGKVTELRKELARLRDEWDDRKHPMGETFWSRY